MRVSLVTKINKFVHIEMFNAVINSRKLLLVSCSKTKSTGVENVHCQRFSCFGRHVGVLERAPTWPPHTFLFKIISSLLTHIYVVKGIHTLKC